MLNSSGYSGGCGRVGAADRTYIDDMLTTGLISMSTQITLPLVAQHTWQNQDAR